MLYVFTDKDSADQKYGEWILEAISGLRVGVIFYEGTADGGFIASDGTDEIRYTPRSRTPSDN